MYKKTIGIAGLSCLALVSLVLDFFQKSDPGYYTNDVAEFIAPIAINLLAALVIISFLINIFEDKK